MNGIWREGLNKSAGGGGGQFGERERERERDHNGFLWRVNSHLTRYLTSDRVTLNPLSSFGSTGFLGSAMEMAGMEKSPALTQGAWEAVTDIVRQLRE